MTKIMKKKK